MRRVKGFELLPFDPEIERTLPKLREEKRREAQAMSANNNNDQQQWAIREYFNL
ncbi:hypothetical protein PanWU01x14_289360, partial [Parasponia andersonii]